jgi:8-oxo-dGTP pyrophosphatase MutT (NUDIX family)
MKWTLLSSEEILKLGYFRLKKDKCQLPDGRIMPSYYTLEFSDWVNVIPMTQEKKIVLIKQYRHSVGETIIEIPGGSTDPRTSEDPKQAAIRELEEETGYTSNRVEKVGVHYPNPALLSNKMHTYIAYDCQKTTKQILDPYEDIEVFEVTKTELKKMILQGEIQHSIILGSLLLALNLWEEKA